jgi:hypothetical protein
VQVGEGVKRLLVSLRKVMEGGNMVILGANIPAIKKLAKMSEIEENLVMDTKTGVKSEIMKKNGLYVYPMRISRKKKDPNAMDISAVGRFEHKNSYDELKEEEELCQVCNDTMEDPWEVF